MLKAEVAMTIDWTKTDDGYTSAFYRIRRSGRRTRWQLEPAVFRIPASRRTPHPSAHATLADAFREAEADERQRRLDLRIRAYVVLAVLAAVVFMAGVNAMRSLSTFVVTVLAGYLTLRLFAAAIGLRIGEAWGWSRDDGTLRRDKWFEFVLDRITTIAQGAPEWPAPDPAVRLRVIEPNSDAEIDPGIRSLRRA